MRSDACGSAHGAALRAHFDASERRIFSHPRRRADAREHAERAWIQYGWIGKWGIGGRGTSGVPEKHGFDTFFGYYDQVHAHTFYPRYLIRNSEEVLLPGNEGISFYEGETHAQDEIFRESMEFIVRTATRLFFATCLDSAARALGDR